MTDYKPCPRSWGDGCRAGYEQGKKEDRHTAISANEWLSGPESLVLSYRYRVATDGQYSEQKQRGKDTRPLLLPPRRIEGE